VNFKKTVKREERHTVTLDGEDILAMLRQRGHHVHPEAKVVVRVPGGGDWSNMDLVIGEDAVIGVSWKVIR